MATGEILFTVNEDCTCPVSDVLSKSTKNIAQKLAQSTRQKIEDTGLKDKTGALHISRTMLGSEVDTA